MNSDRYPELCGGHHHLARKFQLVQTCRAVALEEDMEQGVHAQRAIASWRALVDAVDSDLARGICGRAEEAAADHARCAIALARAKLDELDRTNAAPKAGPEGQRALPGAMRRAKRERDALLRLGVYSQLRHWACVATDLTAGRRRDLVDLVIAFSRVRLGVPPGIAPAPAYAATAEAAEFFDGGLRHALKLLASRYDELGAAFGVLGECAAMNGTVAAAQRLSGVWTVVACAVFVDWLHRRSTGGGVESACRSLWQFSEKDCPVQFRSPEGLAVLPTADRHMQLDLWTQWVLAQVLEPDTRRSAAAGVDGRWHPIRLNMRDFAGKAEHGRNGNGRLHSGLAIGMIYQTLVIDRIRDVVAASVDKEVVMGIEHGAQAPEAIEVPLPACCAGQRLTMRVVWEWRSDAQPQPASASTRFAPGPCARGPGMELEAAFQRWRGDRLERRRERDRHFGIEALDTLRLGFVPDGSLSGQNSGLLTSIGHVDLSELLHAGPLWIDLAAVAWQGERWSDLHLQLVEGELDGARRDWLAFDTEHVAMLADAGLNLTALQSALADTQSSLWVWRTDGVGAFLSIGVDLTAHCSHDT